jgi:hypothetical protein
VNDWTKQIRIHREEAKAEASRIEKVRGVTDWSTVDRMIILLFA